MATTIIPSLALGVPTPVPTPEDPTAFLEYLRGHYDPSIPIIVFYGHTPKTPIGPPCLSQFFPAPFQRTLVLGDPEDRIGFKTAEQSMMAEKAACFDPSMIEDIIDAKTPAEAKRLGRQVENYNESVWNEVRFRVVVEGNIAKFSQNPHLKTYLLSTNNAILVEACKTDRIWGVGLGVSDPLVMDPKNWKGQNLLGFALMVVRERLARDTRI